MLESSQTPSPLRKIVALFAWLLLCFAAAATGTFTPIGTWYAGIRKPEWNPPAWVFGPVWTVLYCMMAVAAWMVWCDGGWKKQTKPLIIFCVQLALNALWTPLFFGMHRPDLALLDILAMWVAIVLTLLAFWRVKSRAGMLLIPYLAWVSFATFLNFTLWRLNP